LYFFIILANKVACLLACLAYVRIQSENHKHELLTVTVYMFTDAITCVSDSREMKQYIRRNLQQV